MLVGSQQTVLVVFERTVPYHNEYQTPQITAVLSTLPHSNTYLPVDCEALANVRFTVTANSLLTGGRWPSPLITNFDLTIPTRSSSEKRTQCQILRPEITAAAVALLNTHQ